MDQTPVSMSMRGPVALLTVDDGKVNALDDTITGSLLSALGTAEKQADAVVLAGRPGVFSAGLDVAILQQESEVMSDLFHQTTDLVLRLAEFPRPVVAACTGHALAVGALLLLCCDVRVGAAGDYRIGFTELSLGLPLPELTIELARARLSPRYLTLACNTAQVYTPDQAVHVGFLDSTTTTDAVEQACGVAAGLAQRLDSSAFAAQRQLSKAVRHDHAHGGRSAQGQTCCRAGQGARQRLAVSSRHHRRSGFVSAMSEIRSLSRSIRRCAPASPRASAVS